MGSWTVGVRTANSPSEPCPSRSGGSLELNDGRTNWRALGDFLSTFLDNPGARKARRGQPRPADAPEFATGEAKPRRRANPTRRAEQSGACGLSRSQGAPRLGRG